MDKLRYQLQLLRIEKQNQLLVSNSLFGQNQKDLERMRSLVKMEEEEKDHQEDNRKKVSREFSQIMQAIRNIFNRCQCTMRNKVKTTAVNREAWEYNLEVIYSRIKDLIEIVEEYKLSVQLTGTMAQMGIKDGYGELTEKSISSTQTNTPANKNSQGNNKMPTTPASGTRTMETSGSKVF